MRNATVLSALLLLLVVGAPQAQDEATGKTAPKLVKLSATTPKKQVWKNRDVIRNGGFDYGTAAWAMNGGMAVAGETGARTAGKGELGASIDVSNALGANGFLCQMLHLPQTISAAALNLQWRIQATAETASLGQFSISLGYFDEASEYQALASITTIDANSYPGADWQEVDHALGEGEIKAINKALKSGVQPVLIANIAGDLVRLDMDDVSLTVSGEFTPPKTPTFLAYTETHKVKGPDGAWDQLEVTAIAPDGSTRKSMFLSEPQNVYSYGLAWRPDGMALCLSSTHDAPYSYFTGNLFELTVEGMHRVTNPPGRDTTMNDKRKTGSVKLKVRNYLNENVQGAIWIDGGRKLGAFALGPADSGQDSAEVLIEDVVDFGDELQYVVVRVGGKSALSGALVDVKAGETVEHVGEVGVGLTLQEINAASPSYLMDGKTIAFAKGNVFTVAAEGGVPTSEIFGNLMVSSPAVLHTNNALAYSAFNGGIWVLEPGAEQAKEIIKPGSAMYCEDPVWFHDGSGLLFTVNTSNQLGWSGRNLAIFVTETAQTAQLTDMFNEQLRSPTISPDGQWVAAIREMIGNDQTKRELWIYKIDSPNICWQIETRGDPAHPAWCPR